MNLKDALYSVITGNMMAQVMTGLAGLVIIHQLSPTDYAQFTLFQTLLLLVVGVAVNPFNRMVIISEQPLPVRLIIKYQLVLVLGLIAFSFYYFKQQLMLVALFALGAIALLAFECLKSYSQRNLDFSMYRKLVSKRAACFAVPAIVVAVAYDSVYLIALVMAASWFSISLYYWRRVKFSGEESYSQKVVIRTAFSLFIYFAFSSILSQMDLFFLRYFSSDYELATYGASFQYYLFLILVMNSLKQVLLPMFSRGIELSLTKITTKLIPVYLAFTLGVVVLIVFAPVWTSIIEQGKYETTDTVFGILAASSVFSLIFSPASELLQSKSEFLYMNIVLLCCVLLNFALNISLVETYGARGVAVGTLITFALLNIAFFVRGRKL
ncbi:lipopolysaccharide biosynthesis protein [Vibrio sp. TBV020]|uniref:lipopolysaccharide biosynthesis protein n=1 Tax=Vibrio sp. TBV020 TaxID=3137398 RepID=UPI0038CDBDE1